MILVNILKNQQIINQQIIVEYDTIQMAKEQYTDYKAMAIMGYGDSLSSTYSTDKIIVYCSPIVYDKGNMFLPLFEYEMYYVNMYIVYGNYLIKITGTANTLLLTYHSIDETLKKIILILE
ncbi:MAG: hypothetical protein ACOX45_09970 [Acutalibacteraceae bacterium]